MQSGKRWPRSAVVLLVAAVALCVAVRVHRLDLPLERDEGEYAYGGQLILRGQFSYAGLRTLKLPGVHAVAALAFSILGETPRALRLALLAFDLVGAGALLVLARRFFSPWIALAAASAMLVSQMSLNVLGLFAHAENFALAPALAGLAFAWRPNEHRRTRDVLAAGLLLGLAFLMKQPAAIFAPLALLGVFRATWKAGPRQLARHVVALGTGLAIPFGVVCLWMLSIGGFADFWQQTVTYARSYGGGAGVDYALKTLDHRLRFWGMSEPGAGVLALVGLVAVFARRELRESALALFLLLAAGAIACSAGFYYREHYFVFLAPALALAAACGADSLVAWTRAPERYRLALSTILLAAALATDAFCQRVTFWLAQPAALVSELYRPSPFAESPQIAELVRARTTAADTIGVLGSEPQIPFLAGRRSASGYVYMYPLVELQPLARAMQDRLIAEMETARPKVLVWVRSTPSWLVQAGSDTHVLDWFQGYARAHYHAFAGFELPTAGEVVPPGRPPNGVPRTQNFVVLYERNAGS